MIELESAIMSWICDYMLFGGSLCFTVDSGLYVNLTPLLVHYTIFGKWTGVQIDFSHIY